MDPRTSRFTAYVMGLKTGDHTGAPCPECGKSLVVALFITEFCNLECENGHVYVKDLVEDHVFGYE